LENPWLNIKLLYIELLNPIIFGADERSSFHLEDDSGTRQQLEVLDGCSRAIIYLKPESKGGHICCCCCKLFVAHCLIMDKASGPDWAFSINVYLYPQM
jgi:hypothetical protein